MSHHRAESIHEGYLFRGLTWCECKQSLSYCNCIRVRLVHNIRRNHTRLLKPFSPTAAICIHQASTCPNSFDPLASRIGREALFPVSDKSVLVAYFKRITFRIEIFGHTVILYQCSVKHGEPQSSQRESISSVSEHSFDPVISSHNNREDRHEDTDCGEASK